MFVLVRIVRTLWRTRLAPRSRPWDELSLAEQARLLTAEKQRVRGLWRDA
jgi:hypothetical protein